MQTFSPEEAQRFIESAFAPLECAVQFGPYKESLGFQVKDSQGNPLVTREGISKAGYRDRQELAQDIELARENLARLGYSLDEWSA